MSNAYFYSDKKLKSAFNNNLDSHQINHINSKIFIRPTYLEIEKLYVTKIVKDMANVYATCLNRKNIH